MSRNADLTNTSNVEVSEERGVSRFFFCLFPRVFFFYDNVAIPILECAGYNNGNGADSIRYPEKVASFFFILTRYYDIKYHTRLLACS